MERGSLARGFEASSQDIPKLGASGLSEKANKI